MFRAVSHPNDSSCSEGLLRGQRKGANKAKTLRNVILRTFDFFLTKFKNAEVVIQKELSSRGIHQNVKLKVRKICVLLP